MARSSGIFLASALSLALSACGVLDLWPSAPSSDPFGERTVVVFTLYWDLPSTKNLLAKPIVVYERGRFKAPPCTHDEAGAQEFIRRYLTRGQTLMVLRGGRVVGRATVATTAQPKDYCFGMVVPVDVSPGAAAAMGQMKQELLAVTELPPWQPGAPPQPASGMLAEEAKRLVRASLVARGVPEAEMAKMKTQAWTVDLNGDDVMELIVASSHMAEGTGDKDFYSLFFIARREGDFYRPVFVEYERAPKDAKSQFCSTHFLDALNFSQRLPASEVFVQYRCHDGAAYGVYGPSGPRRYVGAYYGL